MAAQKTVTNIVLNNFTNDSRVLKISRSLAQGGFAVRVLALHRDGLPQSETVDGVEVRRVRVMTRGLPKIGLFHALMYFEFTLRVLLRFNDHAIYHCNDLPTLPIGALLKLFSLRGVKIVYDAHEYETEVNGAGAAEKKLRRLLEGALIRCADRTITVSDSIANEYRRLYGIEKPALLLNLPQLSHPGRHDLLRKNLGIAADKTIFLYQGGLSRGRGIEVLLDAFELLDDGSEVLVLMGYGPLEPLVAARAAEVGNIYLHPAVPPEEIPRYSSGADVGIATIENTCLSYYYCLPNKLFEYLMAEIPVIVSSLPEMKALVTANRLGVVAAENSVAGIRQAIREMESFDRRDFKLRINSFNRKYNWQAQLQTLFEIYRGLAGAEADAASRGKRRDET